eukprot:11698760-Heterocapsa_arctica.AAC.1
MGHEGGPGEQCRVARLQQGEGQLSRDFRERRQVGRRLFSNYRGHILYIQQIYQRLQIGPTPVGAQ